MKSALYRPLQLLPVCVLGSVLIGDPPELYLWAETDARPWGDEAVRAILGLGAAALLYALTRAEDRARATERPGWKRPGPLHTAVAIVVVCFLALVLFHLGW
jgi:hypothetical protein